MQKLINVSQNFIEIIHIEFKMNSEAPKFFKIAYKKLDLIGLKNSSLNLIKSN